MIAIHDQAAKVNNTLEGKIWTSHSRRTMGIKLDW